MQQNKVHILHTRRQETTAIVPKHMVFETIPFIRTVLTEHEAVIERIEAVWEQQHVVVFTSANAVRSVARYRHAGAPAWKVYCLGNATRAAVEELLGNVPIVAVADNAHALAYVIVNDDAIQRVVFFCGNKRRDELPVILVKHDIAVEETIVYDTIATPQKLEKKYDGISFFSPGAVESFFSMNTVGTDVLLFAIGETTAASLKMHTADNTLIVCKEPSAAAMNDLIINSFKPAVSTAG